MAVKTEQVPFFLDTFLIFSGNKSITSTTTNATLAWKLEDKEHPDYQFTDFSTSILVIPCSTLSADLSNKNITSQPNTTDRSDQKFVLLWKSIIAVIEKNHYKYSNNSTQPKNCFRWGTMKMEIPVMITNSMNQHNLPK